MQINSVSSQYPYIKLNPFAGYPTQTQTDITLPKSLQADTFEFNSSNPITATSYSQASTNEIETVIQNIIDNGCKIYDIPEELRPTLTVIDSVQFASEDEINKKFGIALGKTDDDADLDIFKDSKKKPQDMTRSEFISYVSKQTNLSKKEVEKIMQTGNGKDKGFYSSVNNSITYYTDGYRQGKETIESTIYHELYHTKEAIIRSSLPQEARNEIVKQELLTRLSQKESRNVFKQFPSKGDNASAMMTVPIVDDKTRKKLIDFAEKNLFTEDTELHAKMLRYSELLSQENPDEAELAKAKADLGGLAEQIEEIAEHGKVYKETPTILESAFGLSKADKNKLLFDYMMSVEFRYQYFRQKEIADVPEKPATKEEITAAQQSMSDHIGSTQATYAMTVARQNNQKTGDELYWQYFTSREEVKARLNSEKKEVEDLTIQYANSIGTTSKAEQKKIAKQLKEKTRQYREDKVYYRFFEAEDKFKANPKNIAYRSKYYAASYNVELMHSTYHKTFKEKFVAGATSICMLALSSKSPVRQMLKI